MRNDIIVPRGVLVLDFETQKVTDVNPFLLTLTGFGREELVGKKIEFEVEVIANRYKVGAQVAVQLNIRDVTERRREERAREAADAALKISNERLKRVNSDLEQFAHAAGVMTFRNRCAPSRCTPRCSRTATATIWNQR
jgi:hypothetical protein